MRGTGGQFCVSREAAGGQPGAPGRRYLVDKEPCFWLGGQHPARILRAGHLHSTHLCVAWVPLQKVIFQRRLLGSLAWLGRLASTASACGRLHVAAAPPCC